MPLGGVEVSEHLRPRQLNIVKVIRGNEDFLHARDTSTILTGVPRQMIGKYVKIFHSEWQICRVICKNDNWRGDIHNNDK